MTSLTTAIELFSESGDREFPNCIHIKMDGRQPDCPVTFYGKDGQPLFSMGNDEVGEFVKALSDLEV